MRTLARAVKHNLYSKFWPHIRQVYPLNLSILLSGGKESKSDFPSNGEWTGISLALRLSGMVGVKADRRFEPLSGAALQTTMFSDIIGSMRETLYYSQPSMQVPLTWANCIWLRAWGNLGVWSSHSGWKPYTVQVLISRIVDGASYVGFRIC